MPNHITTNIRFNDVEKFKEVAISVDEKGKEYVDFNKLIPMPAGLLGNYSWEVEDKYGFGGEQFKKRLEYQETTLVPLLLKYYNDTITQDDFINSIREVVRNDKTILANLKKHYGIDDIDEQPKDSCGNIINPPFIDVVGGFYNFTKYGYCSWYEWRNNNWGTKWNSYDNLIENDVVTFSTAWATPVEWLEKLAEYLDFKCSWADEDTGCNFGIGSAKNGVLELKWLDDVLESYDEKRYVAITIRGNDYEEYIDDLNSFEDDEENKIIPISDTEQQALYDMIEKYI